MSAEIVQLSDYRGGDAAEAGEAADPEIDLATAVDAAIRDLHEILTCWGSDGARQRVIECELMLRRAYAECVATPSDLRL